LAARGIDISTIRNIIHYQLPHSEAEFIHRNGRTARMNASGTAYVLLEEDKPWRNYLNEDIEYIELNDSTAAAYMPTWCTLYISAGKKDKISKFDIVGTLYKKAGLNKEDIGLIQVKENRSYVCITKDKADKTIALLNKNKIKKKRIMVALAN
jgi:ATP-independent RNA helicase DbpA